MAEQDSELTFDVSTGLKRVIGRDLITDDEVAIFELIKNSFDARATQVQLRFYGDSIWVLDNGTGMSLSDIRNKWLFVAYSSKRASSSASSPLTDGYRGQIAERRHFAGSKGIGRFSSDRLGPRLIMQTRTDDDASNSVHRVEVSWDAFEKDDRQQFSSIPVGYSARTDFDLPGDLTTPATGTSLEIRGTRITWNRDRILHLKSSLAKLINPFGSGADGFKIEIVAPLFRKEDEAIVRSNRQDSSSEGGRSDVVNGEVGNFIFSTLQDKTTYIEVWFSEDGSQILSRVTDRAEVVYEIKEPNPYELLKDASFHCQIFYLNQAAKATFTRRMGVQPVNFGSLFVFRNGFRVFPIGEQGNDWFGLDVRKQQGYARFLGTRDLIGRVDVSGTEDLFKEASSRNQGLISTPAVDELRDCVWEYCVKRLERYVVPVSWVDTGEKLSEDLSRLLTDAGRARVATAVAKLIDSPDVELVRYSQRLIGVLNERSQQFESSISSLRAIAEKAGDPELTKSLGEAEKRFDELKVAEAEARRIAEEERSEKEAAQALLLAAEQSEATVKATLEEERKRSLLITSLASFDSQNIIDMHHQITIYAADLKQQVENCIAAARAKHMSTSDLISRLEQIAFLNQKVLSISRLATRANFRMESDFIEGDVANYVEQYVREGASPFIGGGIELSVENQAAGLVRKFRPMEVAIVVDNLVSNAKKAQATEVHFEMTRVSRDAIRILVWDNGKGLPRNLPDPERVFELGFSRTDGSGLGLYHVRQVLGEMGGSISVVPSTKGTKFQIGISK